MRSRETNRADRSRVARVPARRCRDCSPAMRALAGADELHGMRSLRERWPAKHAILADEELGVIRIDGAPAPHVRPRFVLELVRRRRAPCRRPARMSRSRSLGHLRDELVAPSSGTSNGTSTREPTPSPWKKRMSFDQKTSFWTLELSLSRACIARASARPRSAWRCLAADAPAPYGGSG